MFQKADVSYSIFCEQHTYLIIVAFDAFSGRILGKLSNRLQNKT